MRTRTADPSAAAALAAEIASRDPSSTSPRQARELYKRARHLGRCDLVQGWLYDLAKRQRVSSPELPQTRTNRAPENVSGENAAGSAATSDFEKCLSAKSAEHEIPMPVLRTSFKRGLIEYTSRVRSGERLPICAEEFAQARVNTLIRLFYGDPDARDCDGDLVILLRRV